MFFDKDATVVKGNGLFFKNGKVYVGREQLINSMAVFKCIKNILSTVGNVRVGENFIGAFSDGVSVKIFNGKFGYVMNNPVEVEGVAGKVREVFPASFLPPQDDASVYVYGTVPDFYFCSSKRLNIPNITKVKIETPDGSRYFYEKSIFRKSAMTVIRVTQENLKYVLKLNRELTGASAKDNTALKEAVKIIEGNFARNGETPAVVVGGENKEYTVAYYGVTDGRASVFVNAKTSEQFFDDIVRPSEVPEGAVIYYDNVEPFNRLNEVVKVVTNHFPYVVLKDNVIHFRSNDDRFPTVFTNPMESPINDSIFGDIYYQRGSSKFVMFILSIKREFFSDSRNVGDYVNMINFVKSLSVALSELRRPLSIVSEFLSNEYQSFLEATKLKWSRFFVSITEGRVSIFFKLAGIDTVGSYVLELKDDITNASAVRLLKLGLKKSIKELLSDNLMYPAFIRALDPSIVKVITFSDGMFIDVGDTVGVISVGSDEPNSLTANQMLGVILSNSSLKIRDVIRAYRLDFSF